MSTIILQHFHNKSYVAGCYLLLLIGKKVILVLDLNLKLVTICQLGFVVKMSWVLQFSRFNLVDLDLCLGVFSEALFSCF